MERDGKKKAFVCFDRFMTQSLYITVCPAVSSYRLRAWLLHRPFSLHHLSTSSFGVESSSICCRCHRECLGYAPREPITRLTDLAFSFVLAFLLVPIIITFLPIVVVSHTSNNAQVLSSTVV